MRNRRQLLVVLMLVLATMTAGAAKETLPITIDCSKSSGSVKVAVRFHQDATSVTVTVNGVGSVVAEKVVRSDASVAKGGTIVVDVPYTVGTGKGGLGINVLANFGRGIEGQASSFGLSQASSSDSARAKSSSSGGTSPVVVPANSTVKKKN